ncbi:MAG: flavin reductase family protein [Planctomycetota bacterium]|nr:MAG: flavin reductase family protein [Planctomycetota bacterium]
MKIFPESLTPVESYHLMISAIVPRPIALISTVSSSGILNAAPFSFFQGITSNPPLLMVSIGKRKGRPKDTLQNIMDIKEFVVNLVPEALLDKMVKTSRDFEEDVSEFEEAGLTPGDSEKVKPPRILESPVNLECKLVEILQIGRQLQSLVVGEVVCYHIQDDLLTERNTIDPLKLRPVGRLGGRNYCVVQEVLERP